jgi:hypothetical protein
MARQLTLSEAVVAVLLLAALMSAALQVGPTCARSVRRSTTLWSSWRATVLHCIRSQSRRPS